MALTIILLEMSIVPIFMGLNKFFNIRNSSCCLLSWFRAIKLRILVLDLAEGFPQKMSPKNLPHIRLFPSSPQVGSENNRDPASAPEQTKDCNVIVTRV